ncbi:hypothetical protein WJX82_006570 [Trebouxia sp. C0006]
MFKPGDTLNISGTSADVAAMPVSSIPATASDSEVDAATDIGPAMMWRWNSSEKEVSHVVSKSATGKGPARVDTVAAGVQIQFGRLLPNGVVEQGDRVLLVQRLAHRIKCDVVIKDIEDTATFYADFGHSFQSIKAAHTLLIFPHGRSQVGSSLQTGMRGSAYCGFPPFVVVIDTDNDVW